ncbi:uncharacterized protein LOC118439148 isoform X2 [Folsomia candida]|uniref:uncharacterized protein LOC118439148 isoform X2 n=1 Tax=Folsomia candida TaxID=158441 RepID=UPI001604DE7B|nr:uncharacterized protein LOC118439148 isoform X2 [Folsomia candida]
MASRHRKIDRKEIDHDGNTNLENKSNKTRKQGSKNKEKSEKTFKPFKPIITAVVVISGIVLLFVIALKSYKYYEDNSTRTPLSAKIREFSEVISSLVELAETQDLDRCRLSNFIPLYQYLRPDENRPSYLNQNLSLPIVQLYAQLRLNRFSVKLGPHYIKLETRCPLCTSHAPNNVQHV